MRALIIVLLPALMTLVSFAQTDYSKTVVTRWAGPGSPGTYQDYLREHPPTPFSWQERARRESGYDQFGAFLILVETTLMIPLQAELDRYFDDLADAGWDPIMVTTSGGTPEAVRNLLQDYWNTDDIAGAVLIGDLPVPWFELYEDWDNNGIPDEPYQVQFPCDLYYMDLNGGWYDGDQDGILDTHLFDWQPEIFVGRLTASPLGDEVSLLRNYLDKNHAFRAGELYLPGVGLAYIDDDWAGSAGQWGGALALATGIADIISEPDSTTAADYLYRLQEGSYAVLLCAHSSPELHQFTENGGSSYGYVWNYQIYQADPEAYFFNLFNCSGCRYTELNYIGGEYIFADTYGLSAVGSTKTGSMLYFEDFYQPIADGESVGEAFRRWFALHGQEPGSVMWAMSWFYGMTHLGDPTLFMIPGVEVASVEVIDDGSGGSYGDGDGIPDAGEVVVLNLSLQNNDPVDHEDLWVMLSTSSTYVSWMQDSVFAGTLPANGTLTADGFQLAVDETTPDNTPLQVTVEVRNALGGMWGDHFDLSLRAPDLLITRYDIVEISGNGDPFPNPGETWEVTLEVENQGGDDAEPSSFEMVSYSGWVTPASVESAFPALAPGETAVSDPPVAFDVSLDCPADYAALILVPLETAGGWTQQQRFLFQVGDHLSWTDEISDPDDALVHYNIAESYYDQWHEDDHRSVSPEHSFKFGGQGGAPYWPSSDGALETPLFKLGETAELRFQHWGDMESGYDGGIVEINAGDGWQVIEPEGGYPGNSVPNGSYPGGPCFNGSYDWQEAVFDLSGYAPFARLRFRFGSDGGVEEEGWYVDDIILTGDTFTGAAMTKNPPPPDAFHLYQNSPNPFNPTTVIRFDLPQAAKVKLDVFDVGGRRVGVDLASTRVYSPGAHEITFDGSGLPSGVYIYRVTAEGSERGGRYQDVGKMLLLK